MSDGPPFASLNGEETFVHPCKEPSSTQKFCKAQEMPLLFANRMESLTRVFCIGWLYLLPLNIWLSCSDVVVEGLSFPAVLNIDFS